MLSDRVYFVARKVLPLYVSLGLLKYTWDSQTNLFRKTSNRQNYKIQTNLGYFFVIIWIFFHIFQLNKFYQLGDLNSFIMVMAGLIALFVAVICLTTCTLWSDELFPTLNGILLYLREVTGKFKQIKVSTVNHLNF